MQVVQRLFWPLDVAVPARGTALWGVRLDAASVLVTCVGEEGKSDALDMVGYVEEAPATVGSGDAVVCVHEVDGLLTATSWPRCKAGPAMMSVVFYQVPSAGSTLIPAVEAIANSDTGVARIPEVLTVVQCALAPTYKVYGAPWLLRLCARVLTHVSPVLHSFVRLAQRPIVTPKLLETVSSRRYSQSPAPTGCGDAVTANGPSSLGKGYPERLCPLPRHSLASTSHAVFEVTQRALGAMQWARTVSQLHAETSPSAGDGSAEARVSGHTWKASLRHRVRCSQLHRRMWNAVLLWLVDIALGVCLTALLSQQPQAPLVAVSRTLQWMGSHHPGALVDTLAWLAHNPAGLKLNAPLASSLATTCGFYVTTWSHVLRAVVLTYARPLATAVVVVPALGGASLAVAVVADAVAAMGAVLSGFHALCRRVIELQWGLHGTLALLFRGKKHNVLRNRTDHMGAVGHVARESRAGQHATKSAAPVVQTVPPVSDQLLLGSILFVTNLLLLPTMLVFAAVFAACNVVLRCVSAVAAVVTFSLAEVPLHTLMSHVLNGCTAPCLMTQYVEGKGAVIRMRSGSMFALLGPWIRHAWLLFRITCWSV